MSDSRLSGFRQRPLCVSDDETIKRRILAEDLERSSQFLRDFVDRHRSALDDAPADEASADGESADEAPGSETDDTAVPDDLSDASASEHRRVLFDRRKS